MATGRVLIALSDGPLVASPTWTRIDSTANLVAGYDIDVGRQTLVAQTDTGTATVYLNDTTGAYDPSSVDLTGRQIMLQLYNPVSGLWQPQFRGHIDDVRYDINPATDNAGHLIVANLQIDCVDIFDYLAGYGLTPGLDGVTPPPGSSGTVWYAQTSGTIDGRVTEILTDVGIDSTRYVVFTGNVSASESSYNADESSLVALRDTTDAELPFIGNMYTDRQGRFVWHGRLSRFTPDAVAASAGTAAWDFHRWKVGDGIAIQSDSARAQIRVLSWSRARAEIINVALAYPKGIKQSDIAGQVYVDSTSVTSYGKHAAQPMIDLQIAAGITTGNTAKVETAKYAQLLVKNKKDPLISISQIQFRSVDTSDSRASAVWDTMTRADISDIVNIAVGYPNGTRRTGAATVDDYYIEGRSMRVRPANSTYDYVELDLNVSPAVWSMNTHGVF